MTVQGGMAPSTVLKAVGSGREVRLDQLPRLSVVLLFGQSTSSAVDDVVPAVREVYSEEQVAFVSVVDLRSIPKLLRKVAEGTMKGRYDAEAKKLREGLDPADHIVILPDWDGTVVGAFGVGDVHKQLALAVVTTDGRIAGTYQGDDPGPAATSLLASAISA